MVQVLRIWASSTWRNPGSTFEEFRNRSSITAIRPTDAEFNTALHEESAWRWHWLRKATGKPMCALLHGTIGVQHAAMAIYQAYYDRTRRAADRRPRRSASLRRTRNDMAGMVPQLHEVGRTAEDTRRSLTAIQRAYNER